MDICINLLANNSLWKNGTNPVVSFLSAYNIAMVSTNNTTGNSNQSKRHFQQWLVILLVFFAFASSALISRDIFHRLPHLEDEVAYLFQARVFAQGEWVVPTPEPRRSYWQPFVVDATTTGKRFGKYTPGYPLVLALGVAMGQPWLINALASALTVALTFYIGKRVFNPDVGLIAALLLAFSPMALLLNASLMGHTPALLFTMTFFFAYLQIERAGRFAWLWGALAGAMLGMLVITRPLTSLAIAFPFVVYSGARLLYNVWQKRHTLRQDALMLVRTTLAPLLMLSIVTLAFASLIPTFNAIATGDASQNMYELVWEYDRIGFGDCCGRNGHKLEKAFFHARYDLSLTNADLFGWQIGDITPEIEQHLLTSGRYYPNLGLSFFILPFGLFVGLAWRSRLRSLALWRFFGAFGWLVVAVGWVLWGVNLPQVTLHDPTFAWAWLGGAALWLALPIVLSTFASPSRSVRYTWLLWGLMLTVVLFQMTYWIGSQRYSTRYYFEALGAASLLAALPLAYIARRLSRRIIYPLLLILSLWGFFSYSLPRIGVLEGFNNIEQTHLDELEARRTDDRPVLVLVTGANTGDDRVRWRAMGTYMALTSPFLDSDIVLAWDYMGVGIREQILERFPDRQIIEMQASGNEAVFVDTTQ
jgi:hypothetical protein